MIIKNKNLILITFILILILMYLLIICQKSNKNVENNKEGFENNKKVIIVHTNKSYAYANHICKKIKYKCLKTNTHNLENLYLEQKNTKNKNIIIHPRTATPLDSKWIILLKKLEKEGVKVVNPPRLLQLTSNKLECSFVLYNNGINHPKTWKGFKDQKTLNLIKYLLKKHEKLIIKPSNSISQGAYVKKIEQNSSDMDISKKIESIPTNPFVIQEYVDYIALYRVIIINGKALPFSFIDRPTKDNWKVSVCLNRTRMKFVPNPDKRILQLGVDTQNVINRYINNPYKGIHFIDIFETIDNKFTISEINTACSLFIHERLAKEANHPNWEISKYIAEYLNSL